MKIKISFETITPESAEQGDVAERGWINEDGVECDDLDDAIRMLKYDGANEPSSTHFYKGIWYTAYGEACWRTGETENRSFHLYDFTEEQERAVFEALTKR